MKGKFRHDPLHINSLSLIHCVGYRKESRHQNVHQSFEKFLNDGSSLDTSNITDFDLISASKGEKAWKHQIRIHRWLGAYVITPQVLTIGFVILIRFYTRNQIFMKIMAKTWKIDSSCFIFWKGRSSNTMVLFTHCDVVWAAAIAFRAHRCYKWFAGDCNFRKSVYIMTVLANRFNIFSLHAWLHSSSNWII